MTMQNVSAQAVGWRVSFRKSAVDAAIVTGTIAGVFQNDCFIVLLDTPDKDGNKADVLHYSILTVID